MCEFQIIYSRIPNACKTVVKIILSRKLFFVFVIRHRFSGYTTSRLSFSWYTPEYSVQPSCTQPQIQCLTVGQKLIIFVQRSFCSVYFLKFRWTTLYLWFLERRVRGNGTKQDLFWKRRQNILDVYPKSTDLQKLSFTVRTVKCSVIGCYKTIRKKVNSFFFFGFPPWLMQMQA